MAIEDGAMHTHSLAMQHRTTWWLEDDAVGDPGTEAALCGERLNEIAEQVTLSQPQALPCAPSPPSLTRTPCPESGGRAHACL